MKNNYLNQTLTQTQTTLKRGFDIVDNIDRIFYGKRIKLFIWSCLLVVVIAPIVDMLLKTPNDQLTFYSTLLFLIFLVILVLALISSWRDDTGNWSIHRAKSRLQTYQQTLFDTIEATKKTSQEEKKLIIGQALFFGGIAWKAFQNISVFIRKPAEDFFQTKFILLRNFETLTIHYSWIPILIGLGILFYLYQKNSKISAHIRKELKQLGNWSSNKNLNVPKEVLKIEVKPTNELVINAKVSEQINSIQSAHNSPLFNEFTTALQNWNPRKAYYEYQYQDRLYRYLRKALPNAVVELEYPIGDVSSGNKGRADIVVNDTILIEIKRDSSRGAIQRAKGQIHQYSNIWNNRGPVILLLFDYDYDHAKLSFQPTMVDLAKLNRSVMTIVAKPK